MKKYVLIFGCILALSACDRKAVAPVDPNEDMPLISFRSKAADTKALLEGAGALDHEKTRIKVYDYMTAGTPVQSVCYINDVIKCNMNNKNGDWDYETAGTSYHWTKTGMHRFFGWLQVDTLGNSLAQVPVWSESDSTLTVPGVTMDKNATQFDFIYSGIVVRNSANASEHGTVKFEETTGMQHLFTALAVKVWNHTGENISSLSIKFKNIQDERSATINYADAWKAASDVAVPDPEYGDGTVTAEYDYGGDVTSLDYSADTQFVPLYNTEAYRLMWPQDDITDSKVQVSYKIADSSVSGGYITNTVTADLEDVFKTIVNGENDEQEEVFTNSMDAGHKYLLQIILNMTEAQFIVIVDPLVESYYDGLNGAHKDYLIKF